MKRDTLGYEKDCQPCSARKHTPTLVNNIIRSGKANGMYKAKRLEIKSQEDYKKAISKKGKLVHANKETNLHIRTTIC